MPDKKYFYPPRPGNGSGTFSDDIVGLQTVSGGGLTLGNFEFTSGVVERVVRAFNIGAFNEPITLDVLNLYNNEENKRILSNELRVYPNYDVSQVLNFSLYGSLSKRLSVSVIKIINFFPAALDIEFTNKNLVTGYTAENIYYDINNDETYFEINRDRIFNPFGIEYETNNISFYEVEVSKYRNLNESYLNYCVDTGNETFKILSFSPLDDNGGGNIGFYVSGSPFGVSGATSIQDYRIRPNDLVVDKIFYEDFDEIEQFLLNRLIQPIYTATFQIPAQNDYGQFYVDYRNVTWPKDGVWNLDIRSNNFDDYLRELQNIGEILDSFKTNLISRFLVSDSLKEFDTLGRKVESLLQIYGRSFDEIKKFIDGLAYMNSVNYNPLNDIPSKLLSNLAKTLGWDVNIKIDNDENLSSYIFGASDVPTYPGYARSQTPSELNFSFFRNIILNSAYLFRSKGTRRSIEFIFRLIGVPDILVELNEHIYLADQKINLDKFNKQYINITGGTYVKNTPAYLAGSTYKVKGLTFSSFTTINTYESVSIKLSDYPFDKDGYPSPLTNTNSMFFQKGSGWYECTPYHRSPDKVNVDGNIFTGQNINIQTELEPFSYGEKYLNTFRFFPYVDEGFKLKKIVDNKKSWLIEDDKLRVSNDGNYNAYYYIDDERLLINVKNVDVFINPSLGLVYDVWNQSVLYDYPISNSGLTSPYPILGGVDSTFINPKPKTKSFFEFANTFWKNMINVRNRMYISDGKTGGYPTLQSIFWKYIESNNVANIPNNEYTYQKLIDYVSGLNQYWINLVEQMIPATTIWNTGLKFENSIFHRQKFSYKRQLGCKTIKVPFNSQYIISNLFDFNCGNDYVEFSIYPWNNGDYTVSNFESLLFNRVNKMKTELGLNSSNCINESLSSIWYVDFRINNNVVVKYQFYNGYGDDDVPTLNNWKNAINTSFASLPDYGYNYYISDDRATIYGISCDDSKTDNIVNLNVGIELKINCD
jgi:hypothetical protein